MVYLCKKDGVVRAFYSQAEMRKAGFTFADRQAEDEEFNSNGCYAHIADGKVALGRSASAKDEDAKSARILELKSKLFETDYIACKIAEGAATVADYSAEIALRQNWRQEIASLSG